MQRLKQVWSQESGVKRKKLLACGLQAQDFRLSDFLLRMRVRKYKVSEEAARQLAQNKLTVGDVALVLRFGRRRRVGEVERFFLGAGCVPQGCERKLKRLLGMTVVIEGEEIKSIHHRRLRRTGEEKCAEKEK